MKKLNKKGFTLIELLAVIVVLAIIMVIATQQVTKAINSSKNSSFESACKMIVKEAKRMNAESTLSGATDESECTSGCATKYNVSSTDYNNFTVSGGYVTFTASGKFNGATTTEVDEGTPKTAGKCYMKYK